LADLLRTVYPHSGHPLAEGQAHDRVSSPAFRQLCYATNQPTKFSSFGFIWHICTKSHWFL